MQQQRSSLRKKDLRRRRGEVGEVGLPRVAMMAVRCVPRYAMLSMHRRVECVKDGALFEGAVECSFESTRCSTAVCRQFSTV